MLLYLLLYHNRTIFNHSLYTIIHDFKTIGSSPGTGTTSLFKSPKYGAFFMPAIYANPLITRAFQPLLHFTAPSLKPK